jgi:hypothetical protein
MRVISAPSSVYAVIRPPSMSPRNAQPRSDFVFLLKRKGETVTRRGFCSWDVDYASWVVTLHSPEEQDFSGKTLKEALAWCLV